MKSATDDNLKREQHFLSPPFLLLPIFSPFLSLSLFPPHFPVLALSASSLSHLVTFYFVLPSFSPLSSVFLSQSIFFIVLVCDFRVRVCLLAGTGSQKVSPGETEASTSSACHKKVRQHVFSAFRCQSWKELPSQTENVRTQSVMITPPVAKVFFGTGK